jgi:hypothetical protein
MLPTILALQQEVIKPKLYHVGIMGQDIRAMLRSEVWRA